MTEYDQHEESQWCLVGNIVEERRCGKDGDGIKSGSKHFAPGTKVYAFPAQWGDGYESIMVVARHRGSKRFVTMVIESESVTNWRAKVVYHPEVLRRLQEGASRFWKAWNWKGKEEVALYLTNLKEREDKRRNCEPPAPASAEP